VELNLAGGASLITSFNSKKVAALEKAYDCIRGRKPCRVNPKSGSGMEQAQQITRGAKRREGEKP
jgi:hypothetical protein